MCGKDLLSEQQRADSVWLTACMAPEPVASSLVFSGWKTYQETKAE
jgi:hypothetical protein